MIEDINPLHKIADARATLYADKLYSCFDDPSPINIKTSEEDYAAGFEDGVQYRNELVHALKLKVAELVSIAEAFDEKCSQKIAMELEALCRKL